MSPAAFDISPLEAGEAGGLKQETLAARPNIAENECEALLFFFTYLPYNTRARRVQTPIDASRGEYLVEILSQRDSFFGVYTPCSHTGGHSK